ncbi:MAG TPA: ParB/RepB/Spo0J family partition protein [Candidatus Saccharimonadales bacterium]|nr:ParB/RepB/Spo0J family partition protein [Candidatus Saccharimonadales bacterium]
MNQTPKRGLGKGLGKGFDALISDDFDKSLLLTADDRVEKIPVKALQPSPYQPRKHFDEAALAELADSIKRHGIIQPLVVTPEKNGYTLVAGERRWRAAALAGLDTVPAIVRARKQQEQMEIALIENVQRVDLNPLEQAVSIERLHEQFNLSYETIAQRLGKATSTVNNSVRLLQLPEPARQALAAGQISEGHARAILSLKGDHQRQLYLLQTIIKEGWSVRQAERFASSVKVGIKETKQAAGRAAQTETAETKKLSKSLAAPVHLRRMARGGKLEITFTDDADLKRIINTLS